MAATISCGVRLDVLDHREKPVVVLRDQVCAVSSLQVFPCPDRVRRMQPHGTRFLARPDVVVTDGHEVGESEEVQRVFGPFRTRSEQDLDPRPSVYLLQPPLNHRADIGGDDRGRDTDAGPVDLPWHLQELRRGLPPLLVGRLGLWLQQRAAAGEELVA